MMSRPEEQRPKKKEKKSHKKSIRIVSVVVIIAILAGTIVSFCYKKSDSVATPIQEQIVEQPIQTTTEYSILENYAIPSNRPLNSKNYSKIFCDNNDIQLIAAKKNGINQIFKSREDFTLHPLLMEINSCALYKVNKLTHSLPYLVPSARVLLDDIAIRFQQKVQEKYPTANYRIIVTSLLRTEEDIRKLRRRNRNASENSCHRFGTTFDIAYMKYDKIGETTVNENILKDILAQTLYEMRIEERCFVKYERRQRCFHITIRNFDIEINSVAECIDLIKKYAMAESGNGSFEIPKIQTTPRNDKKEETKEKATKTVTPTKSKPKGKNISTNYNTPIDKDLVPPAPLL